LGSSADGGVIVWLLEGRLRWSGVTFDSWESQELSASRFFIGATKLEKWSALCFYLNPHVA